MDNATTPTPNQFPPSDRSQIKRLPKRGSYGRDTIHAILDEGLICHIGFAIDGQPFVIPTAYGRVDDCLYLHGSPASRMLKSLQTGIDICVTVTLLDGLVLARSAFHHSMNYRSVVIFGRAQLVTDFEQKEAALRAFTNHVICDRWNELRPVKPQEIKGTTVLTLPLQEASAKIRTGPPKDDEVDYAQPIWAGVVPLKTVAVQPTADDRLLPGVVVPPSVQNLCQQRFCPVKI